MSHLFRFFDTVLQNFKNHNNKISDESSVEVERLPFFDTAWFFDTVLTNFKNHNNKISDESSVEVERLP